MLRRGPTAVAAGSSGSGAALMRARTAGAVASVEQSSKSLLFHRRGLQYIGGGVRYGRYYNNPPSQHLLASARTSSVATTTGVVRPHRSLALGGFKPQPQQHTRRAVQTRTPEHREGTSSGSSSAGAGAGAGAGGGAGAPPQPQPSTFELLKRGAATGLRILRGAFLVVIVGYGVFTYFLYKASEAIPPEGVVLKLNFEKPFPEAQPSQLFPALTLKEVIDGLDTAAKDPRVKAIVATIGSEVMELPIAQVQELRDALQKFRLSKKAAYCHAETFGGNTDYYLATSFDKIVMQPSGWLSLTGISISSQFFRGLFDKLEIEPQLIQRHEYKNFANSFNEKGFTAAHREAVDAMATSLHKQLVSDIAQARGVNPRKLQALIDRGPLLPLEALEAGLVDVVGYRDAAYNNVKAIVLEGDSDKQSAEIAVSKEVLAVTSKAPQQKKVRFMSFKKYVKKVNEEKEIARIKEKKERVRLAKLDAANHAALKLAHEQLGHPDEVGAERTNQKIGRKAEMGKTGLPKVAVIYATGEIISGNREGSSVIASSTFSTLLRTAVRDKDIKAIVLRVNSPGGSATASDTIWWETVKAKEAGLPIVVSMSDYAASGGYYIAAAADRIIAQPGTITGSIGVVFGKFVVNKFLNNKLGITQESVQKGEHASIMSFYHDWKPSERKLCNKFADEFYTSFVSKVAAGRGFTYEQAHKLAKGRAWTGAEAKEIGLVDELGGLSRAVQVAKELAGPLPPGLDYDVVVLPRPKSLREIMLKGSAFSDTTEDEDEEASTDSNIPFMSDDMLGRWRAAAEVVRFLSSFRVLKPLMRDLEKSMRGAAAQGPQFRMDDISVSAKEEN